MAKAAELMAAAGVELVACPGLLKKAQAEFRSAMRGRNYLAAMKV
jgi:hypothetical protein